MEHEQDRTPISYCVLVYLHLITYDRCLKLVVNESEMVNPRPRRLRVFGAPVSGPYVGRFPKQPLGSETLSRLHQAPHVQLVASCASLDFVHEACFVQIHDCSKDTPPSPAQTNCLWCLICDQQQHEPNLPVTFLEKQEQIARNGPEKLRRRATLHASIRQVERNME